MSLDPILWALKDAPVANVEERAVLSIMAERAHEDGCNSYLSQATIAKRALVSDRTVRDRLADMEQRGLIARGDQTAAAHIPADRRPVVYDLLIPYSWFSRIERINDYRDAQGRPPITSEMRPEIADPPPRKRRADLGVPKRRRKSGDTGADPDEDRTGGVQLRPDESGETAGVQLRPDLKDATAGVVLHDGRSTTPTTHVVNSPLNSFPPTPQDQVSAGSGSAAEEGGRPRFDEAITAMLDTAVGKVVKLRPASKLWAADKVRQAMLQVIDAGQEPDAVAWAIVRAAEDPKTVVPTRITNEIWWEQAMQERFVPAPPPVPRDKRCPRHPAEEAGKCRWDELDRRIEQAEQARQQLAEQARRELEAEVGDGQQVIEGGIPVQRQPQEADLSVGERSGV